jgi:molybdopterin-guanine dinucleotide biosynthesis protein A
MSAGGPLGVLLAGGLGRRMGAPKATVDLAGRPLASYPLDALRAALGEAVAVAKRDTPLPELGVEVWLEPDEPRHPRAGIVHALERAGGRAIVVCALDLPLVDASLVAGLASVPAHGAPAVIPRTGGRLQPLLARYEPAALAPLAAAPPAEPLTDSVLALGPRVLDFDDARPFLNVNAPADLELAAQELSRRS